jgi:hypothetical protein
MQRKKTAGPGASNAQSDETEGTGKSILDLSEGDRPQSDGHVLQCMRAFDGMQARAGGMRVFFLLRTCMLALPSIRHSVLVLCAACIEVPGPLCCRWCPCFVLVNVLIEFEFHVDFLDRIIRRLLVLQLWLA